MKTTENAGNSLELELPKRENAQDWTISRDAKLAWLAGVIDGEGYIGITFHRGHKMVKRLTIVNLDYSLLRRVSVIYSELGLNFHYALVNTNNGGTRRPMSITVTTWGSLKKILTLLMPYFTAKRDQAKTMLEFIAYRFSLPYHSPDFGTSKEFLEFSEKLKAMKRIDFDLSTTSRVASQPLPEMVVKSGLQ